MGHRVRQVGNNGLSLPSLGLGTWGPAAKKALGLRICGLCQAGQACCNDLLTSRLNFLLLASPSVSARAALVSGCYLPFTT